MLTRVRARMHDERGVTLVELLVVMMLMGVIGSVVTTSLVRGMKTTATTQSRFEALADLQKSVDRMTRNLRAADPLVFTASSAERAVVEVYRDANFTQKIRYTYTYCPTQQTIHVRTENNPVGAPAATNCASTADPILVSRIANGRSLPAPADAGAVPMFSFFKADGTTPATSAKDAFVLKVTVRRALPKQPAIRVDTLVRLRNVR